METTFNYFEATKPLTEAIALVGTVKLYQNETISLAQALASFNRFGYCEPEIYAKAVKIATDSVLALIK